MVAVRLTFERLRPLRVSLISLVGYFCGAEPMYGFHVYAGYITFLAFMTLFWYLAIHWLKEDSRWLRL